MPWVVEVHPTVPQEATIDCQNALHEEKTTSTATYAIISLEYATKKNEPLAVEMPSLPMCITIQLKTPTQSLLPIAQKKFLQI